MQEFKIGCNWTKRLQLLLLFLFVHVVYGLSQFNLANFDKQIITFTLLNLFHWIHYGVHVDGAYVG